VGYGSSTSFTAAMGTARSGHGRAAPGGSSGSLAIRGALGGATQNPAADAHRRAALAPSSAAGSGVLVASPVHSSPEGFGRHNPLARASPPRHDDGGPFPVSPVPPLPPTAAAGVWGDDHHRAGGAGGGAGGAGFRMAAARSVGSASPMRPEQGLRISTTPEDADAGLGGRPHGDGSYGGPGGHVPLGVDGLPVAPASPLIRVSRGGEMAASFQSKVEKDKRKSIRPRHLLNKTLRAGDKDWQAKRARKKEEKRIHERHRLYHLSYGMMLGMWVSMKRVRDAEELHIDDFNTVRKLFFPREGTAETPELELPHSFKFKDYAPRVFKHLRERFGVNADEYRQSLGGFYDFIEFQSNSRSGQFFFFSHDGRFMIKTQTREESSFLRRIIPHYFRYVVDNPGTFIPRFYGLHRIKMSHIGNETHFTVMHSVFDSSVFEDLAIAKFDLKGSWVGRAASAKDHAKPPGQAVFKDNDLVKAGRKFRLGSARAAAMMEQLRRDAAFLRDMRIMDYSLLVSVRHRITDEDVAHIKEGWDAWEAEGGPDEPAREAGPDAPVVSSSSAADEDDVAAAAAAAAAGAAYADHEDDAAAPGVRPAIALASAARRQRRHRRRTRLPRAHVLAAARPGSSPVPPSFLHSGISAFNLHAEPEEYGTGSAESGEESAASAGRRHGGAARASASASAARDDEGGEDDDAGAARADAGLGDPGSPTPDIPPADRFTAKDYDGVPASHKAVPGLSEDGFPTDEVYNFAIIDILQQYNIRKNIETAWRTVTGVRAGSSCVPPGDYSKRFLAFMENVIV